ncbi:hypothetical protein EJ110_NYTH58426 [Nymphaea thermarum]|nr:hypothetical protein EJ110_NYTH58426 [Nymphaea thermarum]
MVPIIRVLERGVRVIELDLWLNFKKDNILVLHGSDSGRLHRSGTAAAVTFYQGRLRPSAECCGAIATIAANLGLQNDCGRGYGQK